VDCDLSTNGATYFYEGKLTEKSSEIGSFYKIFINSEDKIDGLIKISEYMDFMPSIVKITKANAESYRYSEQDLKRIKCIDEKLREKYDVIIYDCQAGYTDVLKLLLPYVDVNLVVMEADAISSAAIRSFYLKIGDLLNEKKIYQIFNKATDEEYEIYSKISGGTVFTNIETVMFDWKIRKAFSVAQIPDMERTSARYGEQIYNICKVLFNEEKIQEKIEKYNVIIKLNKNEEEEKRLREKINQQNDERRKSKNKMIKMMYTLIVPMFASLILIVFMEMVNSSLFYDNMIMLLVTISVTLISMSLSIIFLNDITKEKRNRIREMNLDSKKLDEILSEKSLLETQFKKIEKSNGKLE
jgi:cellulose biosynthesis protein BcsQ